MLGKQILSERPIMVFTGNANPTLAASIAGYLNMALGKAGVGRFSDGEVMAQEFVAIAKAQAWLNKYRPPSPPYDVMQTLDDGAQMALAAAAKESRAKWQTQLLATFGINDKTEEGGPGLLMVLGFGIFGTLFTTVVKPVLFGVARQKTEALLNREAAETKSSKA